MRFATLAEWLVWQETLHPRTIDLGLDRVRAVYRRLAGQGVRHFTITVGGTNGKGSCVAYLDAILRAQGYRVGTYTSPHLLRYNERIRIQGVPLGDEEICSAFTRVDQARGDTTLSFFEFGTLAALDLFGRAPLDVQILEVGLGGRLDAVNIVDADAVLIGSIALDHQDWLGESRESIGFEKAGVFRRSRPAVVVDPDPPASLVRHALDLPADLARSGTDFAYAMTPGAWNWRGRSARHDNLPLPALAGAHQVQNAAGALALLERIADRWPVDEASIRRGLSQVELDGRFQVLPGDVPIVLDVAHNPQAAGVLAGMLRERFAGRPVHAVFALMRDKDAVGVAGQFEGLVRRWYLPPLAMSRAAAPDVLAETLRSLGSEGVEWSFSNVAEAVAAASANARRGEIIVVFGSFFLVAEFLARRAAQPG
ncbi:MAG: bifunctional tetrahydrofolate synthase/dihydrofolate synthase [Methylotetracoccus sp.]